MLLCNSGESTPTNTFNYDCSYLVKKITVLPHSSNSDKGITPLAMKSQIYLVLLATTFFVSVKPEDRKLLAVNLLYRHGDRTPLHPYPTDPYKVL